MTNEERDKALYRFSDSDVLRNNLDIRDPKVLRDVEARLVADRIEEGVPTGRFDLEHLRDIHHHLFQDVYAWAGEVRRVDISKGGSWFHPSDRIEMGMADVHKRLSEQDFLKGLSPEKFTSEAAEYIGDVNRLHPFREGNGRTQFQYLKQLGNEAGHRIDLTRFERESWIQASIEANGFKTERMAECIAASLRDRSRDREPQSDAERRADLEKRLAVLGRGHKAPEVVGPDHQRDEAERRAGLEGRLQKLVRPSAPEKTREPDRTREAPQSRDRDRGIDRDDDHGLDR